MKKIFYTSLVVFIILLMSFGAFAGEHYNGETGKDEIGSYAWEYLGGIGWIKNYGESSGGVSDDGAADPTGDHIGYADDGGDYKIMIEPIAYFYYNNNFYAMTATEAAKYNTLINNDMRRKMGALTNYLLPVSIMLTSSDIFWFDSYVYSQRNNSSFRFSTNYGGYDGGNAAIVKNGVGVGLITIAPSSFQTPLPDLIISLLTANKSR